MAWEARWRAEQPVHRLGRAEGGRCGGRPEVLDAGGPARYVLGAGLGVIADVGDVANVHAKQRELADHGTPAQLGRCCRCVPPLHVPVRLLHDRAPRTLTSGAAAGPLTRLCSRIRGSPCRSWAFIEVRIIESHSSPSMTSGSTPLIRAEPSRVTVPTSSAPGLISFSLAISPSAGWRAAISVHLMIPAYSALQTERAVPGVGLGVNASDRCTKGLLL